MSYPDPIAYTYEADTHCPDCARARFGECSHGWIGMYDLQGATYYGLRETCYSRQDCEGNDVHVIAPWDEWHECLDDEGYPHTLSCGTCGERITRDPTN